MSKWIDADAFLKEYCEPYPHIYKAMSRAMAEAPSIDIEPKRGEWICHEGKWIDFDYYPTKYECNQCHHYVDVASDKNFCPNCGADMRKESE